MKRLTATLLIAGVLALVSATRADVGPPVEIKMPLDSPQAVSGERYDGVFLLHIHKPGTLNKLRIDGQGWTILSAEFPETPAQVDPGTIAVPFAAIPVDADQPIGLRLRFNGAPARQQYAVGPAHFARRDQPRLLTAVPGSTRPQQPRAASAHDDEGGGAPEGGLRGGTIQVSGRIVYPRIGRDMTGDGDMNDPNDIAPRTIGADQITVRVLDIDPVGSEEMWSGVTDEMGFFNTPVMSADVDADGSGPDLVLRVETFRDGWVDVTDNSNEEWTYYWESAEIEDFEGASYDFGTLTPLDPAEQPAIHIYNAIVRARRFILEKTGRSTPEVQIEWPDDSKGNTAWFEDYAGDENEIHVSTARTYREDTLTHEYGHHYIDSAYVNDPPDPQYCNPFCDPNDPMGNCGGGGTVCGHCIWCPENANDAFNEGWPNWLADVVTRDYLLRYQYDDGAEYQALFTRSQEDLQACCQDGQMQNAITTEGFVGALLRDIEDGEQDDHDSDGIRDLLCLGPVPIFNIVGDLEPTTVTEFINDFLAVYPEYTDRFFATAMNVGGTAYIASFPPDAEPPGVVTVMDSFTHPLGVGGPGPCIQFEFDPAPDDASGATNYSYRWTTNPAGQAPDQIADPVFDGGACQLAGIVSVWQLGPAYISIRAQDSDGNWSSDFATFGPFQITDCNGTGILDVCDISCAGAQGPICSVSPSPCNVTGCGGSSDCNGNFQPDECDLAQGISEDCNGDGIPDECQSNVKHFSGADSDDWGDTGNWLEGVKPVDGDHVCVSSGIPVSRVVFREDYTLLTTLNCQIDFTIDGAAFPWPELEIDEPSFVSGDLTLGGVATLRVNDRLDVAGALNWNDYSIRGPGETNVYGGFNLNPADGRTELRFGHHLSILDGAVNINNARYIELNDTSVFTIGLPVVYTYNGDFNIFTGGTTTTVEVDGQLIRASGAARATVSSRVDNAGLIHNQSGELSLFSGGVHSGYLLSDAGTLLSLGGAHDLMTSSTLAGDDVTFANSGSYVRGGVNITGLLKMDGGECTFTSEADITSYGEDLFARHGIIRFESPSAAAIDFDNVTVGAGNPYGGQPHFDTGEPFVINSLHMVYGTVHGADPITINDSFTWTGGGSITAGGAVACNGPATIEATSSARYLYRQFNNADYATFFGSFAPQSGASFNNLASGTMELRGDSNGLTEGTSTNAGLIIKTQGAGRSTLSGMTNTGTVHAQSGEIYFYFGGGNNGAILGDPNTLLTFNGTHEMFPASSLTGDDVTFVGSASTIRGDVDIAGTLSVGNSSSSATATFTSEANVASYGHTLFVRSGTVRFESPVAGPSLDFDAVTLGEGATSGQAYFDTTQPVNVNTLNLLRGTIHGADPITIHDAFTWGPVGHFAAGGEVTCLADSTIQFTTSNRGLSRSFNNSGYAAFLGAIALSNADYTNLSGATVDLQSDNGRFSLSSSSTLYNNGTLIKSGGAGASPIHVHFRNAGAVEVQSGALEFYGSFGLTYIQTAGQTILNGGGIDMINNAVYRLQGGDLTGVGTVTGEIDSPGGVVRPGLSAGALTIDGDFTQGAAGTLAIELGGVNPGEFDGLSVTGTAALGGELNIALIDGYVPTSGATFVVLTAGSLSGTFDTLSGASGFDVSYTATEVILTASGSPLPGDLDGDCDVDISDLATILANFGLTSGALPEDGDLDGDGDVDISDLATLLSSFGSTCP